MQGQYFSLSSRPPVPGQAVHALEPVSLSRSADAGHVTKLQTSYGMPLLRVQASVHEDAAGGPIVDDANRVVGITQMWGDDTDTVYSVDLVRMTNGQPNQLCFDLGNDPSATICRGGRATPALLGVDDPPPTCGGVLATPPFTYCPFPSSPPRQAPVTTDVTTPLAFTGCWATTADSFDESQKTTTLPGSTPTLYLVYRFNFVRVGTAVSISATGPTGTRVLAPGAPLQITNPASTYWRHGPLNLSAAPLAPGAWTFTVTITSGPSAGAACTSTVTVAG
jgi:hypothetical protein